MHSIMEGYGGHVELLSVDVHLLVWDFHRREGELAQVDLEKTANVQVMALVKSSQLDKASHWGS